jgi:protein-tyrosine phosphatase
MFARLAANEGPLAFNCSAGKDRTGMASALILAVLGAPRETVIADYALSEIYAPPSRYLAQMARGEAFGGFSLSQSRALAALPTEALEVILGSNPEVMRRALAAIDARFGGPINVAKTRLGLSDGKIQALRRLYLS